jgi:MFS family permease
MILTRQKQSKIAFGFVQTAGAGLGMLSFGPLSSRIGRRKTFALMHVFALIMTPVICWVPFYFQSFALMLCLLPIFGFFAQGIHAGYAVYFPELFPTHLRATGAGFCFNTGRILAAPVLIWGPCRNEAHPAPALGDHMARMSVHSWSVDSAVPARDSGQGFAHVISTTIDSRGTCA